MNQIATQIPTGGTRSRRDPSVSSRGSKTPGSARGSSIDPGGIAAVLLSEWVRSLRDRCRWVVECRGFQPRPAGGGIPSGSCRRGAAIFLALACVTVGFAQEGPTEAEVQLRDQLKSTLVQLRDAQGQIAALQGTQLQNENQIKSLESKLAKLEKKSTEDSEIAAERIAVLEKEVAEQDTRNAVQIQALAKWKKSYGQLTDYAKATEAKRAELAAKAILLQRTNDEYAATNRKLYAVGKEILDRYEGFGLGDAITTREPFVGTTRVKFQNLMQDYGDDLAEQKIRQ